MVSIKEAAKLTNLSVSSIRYYEKMGLLALTRSQGNYRLFDEEDLFSLNYIRLMKTFGFSIKEIKIALSNIQENNYQEAQQYIRDISSRKKQEIIEAQHKLKQKLERMEKIEAKIMKIQTFADEKAFNDVISNMQLNDLIE